MCVNHPCIAYMHSCKWKVILMIQVWWRNTACRRHRCFNLVSVKSGNRPIIEFVRDLITKESQTFAIWLNWHWKPERPTSSYEDGKAMIYFQNVCNSCSICWWCAQSVAFLTSFISFNPNMCYLCSTAMPSPISICCIRIVVSTSDSGAGSVGLSPHEGITSWRITS